ncbi:calcineurin-like phosphoesterase family protein [Nocardia tenerifensis]|uniref:Calcineurin-like phosphoesterase family protein n=1 Tax=Nocardia tenerifensis TaxID=228006 RepID=A0A318KWM0_9NOCA|nr:metallophosphoesterase [Nocardia tenerifensis]PXX69161.1 calcineurin-like phosphoesterase family protein [Nocardia tenerifensis]
MCDNSFGRRGFLAGAAGAVAGASLVGLSPAQAVPVAEGVTKFGFPTERRLRVLVTGDAGTGTRTQWAVADAMREFHRREPVSLAVGLGDNIYEQGPNSGTDRQFADKFENPNAGLDFPWLMVLGNHDTSSVFPGDGGWLERGNHEVEYHANSPRWWMPSRYYSVRVPEHNPVVEFFVLDLNPLAAYIPPVLSPYWSVDGPFMNEQRAWLDRAIAESGATWKIACTHHPYLNNGPHGDAGQYEGIPLEPINGIHVKRFIEEHVAGACQFLLSGHDHSLQVLEPTVASKSTRQIVSGAAAKTVGAEPASRPRGEHPALFENYHELGYMVLDLTPTTVDLRVFTVDLATATATEAFARRLA